MDIKTLSETPPWAWPEDAGETFQKLLTDTGASKEDRVMAAELAGDLVVMNDQIAGRLMKIVGSADESEELRARAAISLGPVLEEGDLEETDTGDFDDPNSVSISETTFNDIRDLLRKLYQDESIPKVVRRRILEAAVRSPREWHRDAIRKAYASGDREWVLTAVFAMQWVRGFDDEILESLKSTDSDIHREAVAAAGTWGLDKAWSHVLALVKNSQTPKALLLKAIDAAAGIRPEEAMPILQKLAKSRDEDVSAAAGEALMMAELSEGEDEDELF